MSGDGKWLYSWILNRWLRSCINLHREYSIEPTANPFRVRAGRWQVSIFVDCYTEVGCLPKVAERILHRANGNPCQRQCKWAYLWIVNRKYASCPKFHREYSIEPMANPVRDSAWRWQVSIFVDYETDVGKLVEVADGILDHANFKPCHR